MDNKYAEIIAKELRMIRKELQKQNNQVPSYVTEIEEKTEHDEVKERAGERVTIK